MQLKIKSSDRLSELLTVLSTEGYTYTVETIYDDRTWYVSNTIKYYLVTVKDNDKEDEMVNPALRLDKE